MVLLPKRSTLFPTRSGSIVYSRPREALSSSNFEACVDLWGKTRPISLTSSLRLDVEVHQIGKNSWSDHYHVWRSGLCARVRCVKTVTMGLFLLFFALAFFSRGACMGSVGNIVVGNRVIAPDGFQRLAVLAGENSTALSFPGPLITAYKNDTFRLNVINELKNAEMLRGTSIHWHGLLQPGTSWADGVAGVTQCPISPNRSFEYIFHASGRAGTFWYHSHYSTQYCDGLRGPIVVYDDNDPHKTLYDIDNESTVITLADWYHIFSRDQGERPIPDSTLINGRGRYFGGPFAPLSVVEVSSGKRYRFRLISMSCDPSYTFSIDAHQLTIIEADGQNVQPYTTDVIQIFAGQRYSFVLTVNQPISNYWIRARPSLGISTFSGGLNSAILRYSGAPKSDPTSRLVPGRLQMDEGQLVPLENPGAPGSPTSGSDDVYSINLKIRYDFEAQRFHVNEGTFTTPTVPVLLQIMSGARKVSDLLPVGSFTALPANRVVELSMPAGDIPGVRHPMHLHGHAFDVIRVAGSQNYNFANPVRRDVVNMGTLGDNVTIRFRTDNSGPWILHCHIDWHLRDGLAIVFVEDSESTGLVRPPSSWDELCPIYNAMPPEIEEN